MEYKFKLPDIKSAVKRMHIINKTGQNKSLLIEASPGYGKTYLLVQLATESGHRLWISLTEEDRIKDNFVSTFIKAFNIKLNGNFRSIKEILDYLHTGEITLDIFIDNLNLLTDDSIALLQSFIVYSPPYIKFYLAGRAGFSEKMPKVVIDPQTTMIKENDLKFNEKEIKELARLYDVQLSHKDVVKIIEITEGWPIAVDNILRHKEVKKLKMFFEDVLNKLPFAQRLNLILCANLPDFLNEKYMPDIEELRKKDFPVSFRGEKVVLHSLFVEFLKEKAKKFSKEEKIKYYKRLCEKEENLLLYFFSEQFEKAEEFVKRKGIHSFKDFLLLPDIYLPEPVINLVEKVKDYPHLLLLTLMNWMKNPKKQEIEGVRRKMNEFINLLEKQMGNYKDESKLFALILLENLYYNLANFKKCKEICEKILEEFRNNPEIVEIMCDYAMTKYYVDKDIKEAEKILKEALIMAEQKHDVESQILILRFLVTLYLLYLAKPEEAKVYIDKGLDLSMKSHNHRNYGIFLQNLGEYYYRQGKYDESLYYYKRLIEYADDFNDAKLKWIALGGLFLNYYMKENVKKLEEVLEENKKLKKVFTNIAFEASYHWDAGRFFLLKGQYKRAVEEFKMALEYVLKLGDEVYRASILRRMAEAYEKQGDYKNALQKYKEALEIFNKVGNKWSEVDCLLRLANICKEKDGYLKKALKIIEEENLYSKMKFYGWCRDLILYAKDKGVESGIAEKVLKFLPKYNELNLFGKVIFYRNGVPVEIKSRRLVLLLLLFIKYYKESLQLDRIIELLEMSPKKSLKKRRQLARRNIADLRRKIDPEHKYLIYDKEIDAYFLDFKGEVKIDVLEFKEKAKRGINSGDKDLLREAIDLWGGIPFEDYRYLPAELMWWQEGLLDLYLRCLYKLIEIYLKEGRYEDVLHLCERGLEYDEKNQKLLYYKLKVAELNGDYTEANKIRRKISFLLKNDF